MGVSDTNAESVDEEGTDWNDEESEDEKVEVYTPGMLSSVFVRETGREFFVPF